MSVIKTKKTIKIPKIQMIKKDPMLSPIDSQCKVITTQDQEKKEPKKRGRVKAPPPTREETLKLLSDMKEQLNGLVRDLKEEEQKVLPLQLIAVPELIKATLQNLEEDLEEVEEKTKEVTVLPEGPIL